MPLFLLGPKQQVKLSCKIEYMTKKVSDSRHQAGTSGIDYIEDEKIDTDPVEILFNVNIQTGISSKDLISLAFDNLILRLKKLQETIRKGDSASFYMQLNRYHRYDFVFIGEDHTMGNLIEKWNNRHDSRSVTGYRQPSDGKSIKIDYGLDKFAPIIFTQNDGGDDDKLENLIEKSVISLDEKKEKKQRADTLKIFIENLSRLETYFIELKDDWVKVKIVNVPVKEYMDSIYTQRVERLQR
jgi:DNA-directed RNA polymerase subunit L